MRTTLTLLTLGLTLTLGACEYYECGPGCDHDCDPWDEDCEDHDYWDDDPWNDDADADADADADTDTDADADADADTDTQPEPEADISFELTPAEAEQGDIFIASLSMGGEDAPGYEAISEINFYGDVEILAVDIRSYEVLVSVAVDQDGAGPVDLLVELESGDVIWTDAVLTIYPDGSGHEAGSSGDPDPCE
jgi:hypothetical protein